MAQSISSGLGRKFRESFKLTNKELLHWFPGHMDKGMKQMQHKLKMVDLIIEVHDARIPFSGRNPNFHNTITAIRPHIFVLNKKDLTDNSQNGKVVDVLKQQNVQNIIYTNCKSQQCSGVKKIFPLVEELISNSNRYNRSILEEYNVMVIGVPNVGKSSLINILRNKHLKRASAAPVGGVAGITRSVSTRIKISDDPLTFIFDTPGILTPAVESIEMGFKLALCNCLLDHLVGEELIADFLLYWLNKYGKFKYVELMGLTEPCDDIAEVLTIGAVKLNKFNYIRAFDGAKKLMPDTTEAAKFMIKTFREGKLGSLFLDRDIINSQLKSLSVEMG